MYCCHENCQTEAFDKIERSDLIISRLNCIYASITLESCTGKFVSSSQQDVLLKQKTKIGFGFLPGLKYLLMKSFSKLE